MTTDIINLLVGWIPSTIIYLIVLHRVKKQHKQELKKKDTDYQALQLKNYELKRRIAFIRRKLKDSCDETGFAKYWTI